MIFQIDQLKNYRKLIKKISDNQQITVMFFGGSITEGASTFPGSGVNIDGKTFSESFDIRRDCWREITYKYLKNKLAKFPGQFRQVNASIGGTGSLFGAIRLNDHVLPYQPDLIFIDFAVNDNGVSDLSRQTPDAKRSLFCSIWSIITRLYITNPDIAVFMPLTTYRKGIDKTYRPWTDAMKKSAELYMMFCQDLKIPYLNVYDAYYNNKTDRIETNKLFMGEDSAGNAVHPALYGHEIIAKSVCRCLDDIFCTYRFDFDQDSFAESIYNIDKLRPYPVSPVLIYPETFIPGFDSLAQAQKGEYIISTCHQTYYTRNADESIIYRFKGRMIGAWFDFQSSCSIEIRIDNQFLGCWTCNSNEAGIFGNEQYVIFADELDPASDHVLQMTPSSKQSLTGNSTFMWGIKALFINGSDINSQEELS